MNKKKKEENRKKRGLLTMDEHFEKHKNIMHNSWEKSSKKNKGKKRFGN